jgi:hypothetical protein
VIDAVQTVFAVAAPIAALALLLVLGLREVPLASSAQTGDARPRARHSDPNGGPTGAPRLATEGSHR